MSGRFHRSKAAAVLLAAGIVLGGAAAGAGTGFPDPAGDVKGGAGPDLTMVTVSHTASTVTFRFRFAKAPPLGMSARAGWVDMLLVGIDAPPRTLKRTSLGWTGLDYYAGLHGTEKGAILMKAQAKPSQRKVIARPKVTVSGRTLSFSISRRALGNPAWIELVAAAGRELSDQAGGGGGDEAPDRGTFHYQLRR